MIRVFAHDWLRAKLEGAWRRQALRRKAVTFGLIGVINTTVDYGVFLLARMALTGSALALSTIAALSHFCQCGGVAPLTLVIANLISWTIAVSGSYIMNASITFAAESGRKLGWRRYLAFVASGIVGWLANTAALLVAAEVFLLPIWLAKAVAIAASFLVNFSLSHFVVFRARSEAGGDGDADG